MEVRNYKEYTESKKSLCWRLRFHTFVVSRACVRRRTSSHCSRPGAFAGRLHARSKVWSSIRPNPGTLGGIKRAGRGNLQAHAATGGVLASDWLATGASNWGSSYRPPPVTIGLHLHHPRHTTKLWGSRTLHSSIHHVQISKYPVPSLARKYIHVRSLQYTSSYPSRLLGLKDGAKLQFNILQR